MANGLRLNRNQLEAICGKDHRAIATLEQVLARVDTTPTTIEEAVAQANQAIAMAASALAMVADLASALEALSADATPAVAIDQDDTAPAVQLGSISSQNADSVDITGGTAGLDAGSATLPSLYFGADRASGAYRSAADVVAITIAGTQRAYFDTNTLGVWGSVTASQQVIANAPAGTPPLAVVSTTRVNNLNVDRAGFADTAASLTDPSTYPAPATDLPTAIALANALRTAAISKGL